jgi:hypothetical protein
MRKNSGLAESVPRYPRGGPTLALMPDRSRIIIILLAGPLQSGNIFFDLKKVLNGLSTMQTAEASKTSAVFFTRRRTWEL